MPPSYHHIGRPWNMTPTSHSLHQNLLEQKQNMKLTKSLITEILLQEGSTWFIGKAILMLNGLGNQSQTWAMLWQCSRNIKTDENYSPPYDFLSPITPPQPLLCLSSPHPSPPPGPIPRTQWFKTQQNTLASVALSPGPIVTTIKLMVTPFSTQLDHLSLFSHHLLYATILKNTTAYQALHVFSTNNTLT